MDTTREQRDGMLLGSLTIESKDFLDIQINLCRDKAVKKQE